MKKITKPKTLKIIKGCILILIGLMMFYSAYHFVDRHYTDSYGMFRFYRDYYSFWKLMVNILFIILGILEIGGALKNGN